MNINEHVNRIKAAQAKRESKNSGGNIFHQWKSGDQIIRLSGDFITTKTYWLSKSNFNSLDLFDESAFEGEDRIPKIINCANWNIETEKFEESGDVLFQLNKIARELLKESASLTEEQKKEYTLLKKRTDASTQYRWNILDRDEPKDEEGNLKGFQVASIGFDLFESLISIHEDYSPASFTSNEDGIDIKVTKGETNGRIKYRATPCLKRGSMVISPLTEEELALPLVNLMDICGKQVDQKLVASKLLPNWQDLLEQYGS